MKNNKAAFNAFKLAYDKEPKNWVASFGMAKGYAALCDRTTALKYTDSEIQLMGEWMAKPYVQRFRQALADGKDVSGF